MSSYLAPSILSFSSSEERMMVGRCRHSEIQLSPSFQSPILFPLHPFCMSPNLVSINRVFKITMQSVTIQLLHFFIMIYI